MALEFYRRCRFPEMDASVTTGSNFGKATPRSAALAPAASASASSVSRDAKQPRIEAPQVQSNHFDDERGATSANQRNRRPSSVAASPSAAASASNSYSPAARPSRQGSNSASTAHHSTSWSSKSRDSRT